MRKYYLNFIVIATVYFTGMLSFAQQNDTTVTSKKAFKEGEYFKFRVHFGMINAGYATLNLKSDTWKGQDLYHAVGKGWTVGAAKMFYVVNDTYESYFTKNVVKPVFHKRRVDEAGYLIQRDKYFDIDNHKVTVDDLQKKTKNTYTVNDVQDMVSSFYYLRSLDISKIKEGDEVSVTLFFDGESYPFKLKFLEREKIRTKFGKIKTWKIQPMVQKGRVFESQESLTLWITDDANKVPIRIKASLVVGSLKADLDDYNGLAHPIKFE